MQFTCKNLKFAPTNFLRRVEVYEEKNKLKVALKTLKEKQVSIGLVPTMGALHAGHLELVKTALSQNDCVVVSIFVNPTQFDNQLDLQKYPRTLESDLELLRQISDTKILVYAPTVADVYEGDTKSETFDFDGIEFEMEGSYRKGHFNGVATIVKRLFEIVTPDRAYFGEKDFQQLQIIKKLVVKHKLPITIVPCKIYREASGLAMSSRNTRLEPEHRKEAAFIYKILQAVKNRFSSQSASTISKWVENQFLKHPFLRLEYFVIADTETLKQVKRKSKQITYRAFIAVYAGEIRLIDNIALN